MRTVPLIDGITKGAKQFYVSVLQLWCQDPKGWICAPLAFSAVGTCSRPSTDKLQHRAKIHQARCTL